APGDGGRPTPDDAVKSITTKVPRLHLVDTFADAQKLLEAAEQHGLEWTRWPPRCSSWPATRPPTSPATRCTLPADAELIRARPGVDVDAAASPGLKNNQRKSSRHCGRPTCAGRKRASPTS